VRNRRRNADPRNRRRLTVSALIDALRAHAEHAPQRAALIDGRASLTFAELLERATALAAALNAHGCRTLGLAADNGAGWVIADIAALLGSTTNIPIPPYFTPSQVAHVLTAGGVDSLLLDHPAPAALLAAGFEDTGYRSGNLALFRHRDASAATEDAAPRAAKVTFTSGSTGQPKGVRLSAQTLDAVATRLRDAFAGLGIERHLCVMPLATLLENIAGVYVPLMLGASVHVPSLGSLGLYGSSQIDRARFKDTIERVQAQSLILQPQLLRELTAAAVEHGWRTPSLRFVAVGGARTAEADLAGARSVGIPAYQGYGLSECASVVALNRPGDTRAGSVGRPLPGISVELASDGEILVRGQGMLGYLGEPVDRERTVSTGDLGHLDDDGFLYVTGRKKDVFITSFGRNVSPEWPEAELLHEPGIAQVCVFGEARPTNTAVVFPADASMPEAGIRQAIRCANERLPDYARISDWIIAGEPFSVANGLLTATGKPRRAAIADRYLAAIGDDFSLATGPGAAACSPQA
jgi:long-subunit acyl-CoA synthetase (AMP-forming)